MERYIISSKVRVVENENEDWKFVYNSLVGKPLILNEESIELLNLFSTPKTIEDIRGQCEGDPEELINSFIEHFFLIKENFDERQFLKEKKEEHLERVINRETIDRMGLAISDACNLACPHCIHFQQKNRKNHHMRWHIAQKCIDNYVELLRERGRKSGKIHFGNAEPLLNWKVVEKVLHYCTYEISGVDFNFAINTNLLLLTKEIAEKLKKFNVKIAASLDGTEKGNNLIRIDKKGEGTFSKIIDKFNLLYDIGFPLDGFSVTVTDVNFPFVDEKIINLALDYQMEFIAFDYDLVNSSCIPLENKISKILTLKHYADNLGIEFFGTWDSIYRNLTSGDITKEPHSFCAALEGKSLEFDVDGKIKVCGHSDFYIGDIYYFHDIFKSNGPLVNLVRNSFPGEREYCRECEFEGLCNGQCLVTREACIQKDNNLELFQEMCSFYKTITKKLVASELL
jgi:radical SAM protein with 4Fe4S-binding SPASM domain